MSNEELVAWLKTKGLNDYPDDCTKLESKLTASSVSVV